MKANSQNCQKHDHPEFSLVCNNASMLGLQLAWLLEWLESEVSQGKRFLPEQTVQVGWSVLKVKERENQTLGLFEPDFKSMPIVFVDDVSNTLLHLLLQRSVNESLALENEMTHSTVEHSAIICSDFGNSKGLLLSRSIPDRADSGWFFCCDNPNHNHQSHANLLRVSLYEAATLLDERIVSYLALPAGIVVSLTESAARFLFKEQELSIKPSSYLYKKFVAR